MKRYVSQFFLLLYLLLFCSVLIPASVLVGDQNVESMLDSNAAGRAQAFRTMAGASGVVSSLTMYVDPTSTASQIAIGLYGDSGGHPSSLLTQASFTPQAGAWNTVSIPAATVAAGTQYWIAVLGLGTGRPYFRDTSSPCTSEGSSSGALSALPAVWATGGIWAACSLSAYGSSSAGSLPVAVTIAPGSASLVSGGAQQFSASVTGTSNTAVTWSATGGNISSNGMYSAGSTSGSYSVKATSAADTTKSAVAMVSISAAGTSSASLWPPGTVPGIVDAGDGGAVELGVQFTSSTAGSITGVKFYKSPNNTGTHIGNLWSGSGSLLASATFTNESASGWQTVTFAQPVAIQPNTTYVASYHTTAGHYSDDGNYFAAAHSAPPLQVPVNGGVYVYGGSSFPNQTWNASNYWVDVILQYSSTAPTNVVVSLAPTSVTLAAGGTQQFTATVTGGTNTGVTWSASGGTISTSGLYTASAAAGTYTVKATSAADPTKSAAATVTVTVTTAHSVTLNWAASTSSVAGYNVYRGTQSGGPYTMINTALQSGRSYADLSVQAGQTYFYVVTAVNSSGTESVFSTQVAAVVPSP